MNLAYEAIAYLFSSVIISSTTLPSFLSISLKKSNHWAWAKRMVHSSMRSSIASMTFSHATIESWIVFAFLFSEYSTICCIIDLSSFLFSKGWKWCTCLWKSLIVSVSSLLLYLFHQFHRCSLFYGSLRRGFSIQH